MQQSKLLPLLRLLALTGIIIAISLPVMTMQAAGTSFTISNIQARSAPDCVAGDPHVQYDLTVNVPAGATAYIFFSVTAPGAPSPVNQPSGIVPNPMPGPATVTSFRWVDNNFPIGTIAANTLISVAYSDANSSARAGFTVNCTTGAIAMLSFSGATAGQFFNPNDGRIDPQPGDRLAVWCNIGASPANIDIWGVDNNSHGFRLIMLKYSDVVAAGPHGLISHLGKNGAVSVGVDSGNNFWIAWTGGLFGASGQNSWAKGVNCPFKR